ncbi:hypothetical protein FA95DRAFT_1564488 [Auriscalpium vulgare]|uniref:Uncharacterized protein n=1 Tax=Auriscalpium vulgare TaxID=40419 RepID=A0ACB8RF85_9AGAM|nr:hypothetical protein FA95DRAFT_1564488 [Auriscalpium vulgare]
MGNSRSLLSPISPDASLCQCHESESMTTSSTFTLIDKPDAASNISVVAPPLVDLFKNHTHLNKVDPIVLSVALFKAMGYSNAVGSDTENFYPPTEFVIYLEFIEWKARGNTSRTRPAESLSEAAYTFLSRFALPPSSTPSFPRNLVTTRYTENAIRHIMIDNEGNLSKADQKRLAAALFEALGLRGYGPCPPPDTVILLEFIDAQIRGPTMHQRKAPAKTLVGAVYYFMFRRAASRGLLPDIERYGPIKCLAEEGQGEEELLRQVDMHPDLNKVNPAILCKALYISIGNNMLPHTDTFAQIHLPSDSRSRRTIGDTTTAIGAIQRRPLSRLRTIT